MRKTALERYLIISSLIFISISISSFIITLFSQPTIHQHAQQGTLFDLIEIQSRGLIELDDFFDDILD